MIFRPCYFFNSRGGGRLVDFEKCGKFYTFSETFPANAFMEAKKEEENTFLNFECNF